MKLTLKQQRFVDFYDGNATRAAIQAGYSKKTAYAMGVENLRKPQIQDAIQHRLDKEDEPLILNRMQRQQFWSQVMSDPEKEASIRLRASELLAKSEGDFVERRIIEGSQIQFIING